MSFVLELEVINIIINFIPRNYEGDRVILEKVTPATFKYCHKWVIDKRIE